MNRAWKITGAIIGIILGRWCYLGCGYDFLSYSFFGYGKIPYFRESVFSGNKWSYGLRFPYGIVELSPLGIQPRQNRALSLFSIIRLILLEPVISRRETFI